MDASWGASVWPTARRGWLALGAAAVGLGSWLVLPLVGALLSDTYPITDTIAMPIIGLVLTVAAAVVNSIVLWPGRQRSSLNIVATIVTIMVSVFFGVFVIGEGISGI